jgi:hypothetical protein
MGRNFDDYPSFYTKTTQAQKYATQCILDVLWGQPNKLIQVASNSELRENQWNDLLFF